MLVWPYRRFLAAFERFQVRDYCEKVDARRDAHIAALYANSNWDSEKADREGHVKLLNDYYELLKDTVREQTEEFREQQERLREAEAADPFLRAGRRAMARATSQIEFPGESSIRDLP